jgi:radical SAM protein with 4Fe4S-binding SPASM domain
MSDFPRVSFHGASAVGRRFMNAVRFGVAMMRAPLIVREDDGAADDLAWWHCDEATDARAAVAWMRSSGKTGIVTTTSEHVAAIIDGAAPVCFVGSVPPDGTSIIDLGGSTAIDAARAGADHAELRFAKILGRLLRTPDLQLKSPVGWPIKAMIEVVRVCNLRCPICPVGNGTATEYPNMPPAKFEQIVAALAPTVFQLELYNYGEPLLHRKIGEIIGIAKRYGIEYVQLTTNGTVMSGRSANAMVTQGLDLIRFSIDGATQETYEKYRVGGSLAKIWRNIGRVAEARRQFGSETPVIEAQFVINRYNEHETGLFRRLARGAGADRVRFKTFNALMSGAEFAEEGREFLPVDTRHSRYANYEGFQHRQDFKQADCEFPWETVVVNGDGQVVPCCYDYNSRHRLGSFPSRGRQWWHTDARRAFRDTLRRDPMKIDICAVCPLCPSSSAPRNTGSLQAGGSRLAATE